MKVLRNTLQKIEECGRKRRTIVTLLEELSLEWEPVSSAITDVVKLLVDDEPEQHDSDSKEELVNYLNVIADRLHRHEVLPMDEVRGMKGKLVNHFDTGAVGQFIKAVESFQREDALEILVNFVEQLLDENME